MPILSTPSTTTLSTNLTALGQIENHQLSSPTKNPLQKLKDVLRSLVKILNRLALAKEAIMRIFNAILNSILSKFAAKTPLPSATERLKDTPELLIKIFEFLPPKFLMKNVRFTNRAFENAANIVIKSVEVRDMEALEGLIRIFGRGGLHVTFASDFHFPENPEDLAKLFSDASVTGLKFDRCSGLTDAHLIAVFQQCTNLKAFSLANQDITDDFLLYVPTTLRKLDLFCWGNITDEKLGIALQRCENLEKLSVRWCNRTKGTCLQYISATLTTLELTGCENFAEEPLIVALQKCKNLKELNLNLRACELTVIESFLQNLSPTVTILKLSDCEGLTDENLGAALQQCTNLKEFRLIRCNGIEGSSLQHIPPTVEILEIFYINTIIDVPATAFEQCINLEVLILEECWNIKHSGFLRHLSPSVKRLEMVHSGELIEEDLIVALQRCNSLEVLFVRCYLYMTGRFLQHIPTTVKILEMSCTYNSDINRDHLTDTNLMALQRCTNLEELTLACYEHITGSFLQHVCATVKKLSIYKCDSITDENLSTALQKSTNLEYLSISFENCGTSNFLKYSPVTLKELHLSGFRKLTDGILGFALQKSKNLYKLDLDYCDLLRGSFLQHASDTLRELHMFSCENFTVAEEKYPNLTFNIDL